MVRKNFLTSLFTIAFVLTAGLAALAQTGAPVNGQVLLKDADGKTTPVAGALVEVYRVDIKSKFPSDKTDKKGYFRFAGLPFGATFAFSISGPGIAPHIEPGIRAGMTDMVIKVNPGNGQVYTEDEVRKALSGAVTNQTGELTEEQKKQQAETEAKIKEITAKNDRIKAQTEAVQKALDEGNAAFTAKDYNTAVTKYEEGYQANPDFVGSAPVLLNNKGAALRSRAVITFNENVKSKDPSVKLEGMKRVRQDLSDAIDAYTKSWTLLKNAPATDINDPKQFEGNKVNCLNGAREAVRLIAVTEQVDDTKVEAARALITEYLGVESDQVKKTEASRLLGDIFRVMGDSDNAILEYKKVLEVSPDDPDTLAGVGFSLVNQGYITNDKAKFQEGVDMLNRFIGVAPPTHKFVEDAKGLIDTLKKEQNVTPQKAPAKPTTTRRKN